MEEEWRAVVGYEGVYEVSDKGGVRSLPRHDRMGRPVKGGPLSTKPGNIGYPVVSLWKNGEGTTVTVHSLVAEAFIGPRPEGMDVAHRDGTRTNNSVENLRYLSRQDNLIEAVKHGTNWQTAKTHCPRGHMYSGSNLKVKQATPLHRSCRACTQERTNAHHTGREFDKKKADAIYFRRLEQNGETHE